MLAVLERRSRDRVRRTDGERRRADGERRGEPERPRECERRRGLRLRDLEKCGDKWGWNGLRKAFKETMNVRNLYSFDLNSQSR